MAEAAKSGSSEQEIVSVAIRQLPADIRERLQKLFEEGLLKEGDLDLRSITVFASLNEGLQARVMNHMEGERIYVANARSKSGFLIATCDKAKTGCLDARGLGAIDPWRTALVAMATPKQKMIDLQPERDWIEKYDEGKEIKIKVSVKDMDKAESELGKAEVEVELPLTETASAVKAKLVSMGLKALPANRMKLHTDPVGFIKDSRSFAFYNLEDGVTLTLSERKRAGTRFRSDHTVMPKRPRTQPAPGETPPAPAAGTGPAGAPATAPGLVPNPLDALKNLGLGAPPAPKLPQLPVLPKLPQLPTGGLPGLPGLPGMTGPGGAPAAPALPGTGPAPGLGGGLGGLLPGLGGPKAGGGPGMPGMPHMAMMAKGAPGPPPGAPPGPPMGMPGMPGMGMPGMAQSKGGMPGGMPGMPGMPGMGMAMPKVLPDGMGGMGKAGMPGPPMGGPPMGGMGGFGGPPMGMGPPMGATAKGGMPMA